MAGEITASAVFQVSRGGFSHIKQLSMDAQDLDTSIASGGIMSVGSSGEAIPVGDLFKTGWAYFKNLDAAIPIEVGIDSSGFLPFLRLAPGQFAGPMPLGCVPYAKADTAGAELEFYILERQGAYS